MSKRNKKSEERAAKLALATTLINLLAAIMGLIAKLIE